MNAALPFLALLTMLACAAILSRDRVVQGSGALVLVFLTWALTH